MSGVLDKPLQDPAFHVMLIDDSQRRPARPDIGGHMKMIGMDHPPLIRGDPFPYVFRQTGMPVFGDGGWCSHRQGSQAMPSRILS